MSARLRYYLQKFEADLQVVLKTSALHTTLLEKLMSGEDDLKAAVAKLESFADVVITELQALQTAAGDPDADVEALSQRIDAVVAKVQSSLPAATPPAAPAAPSA